MLKIIFAIKASISNNITNFELSGLFIKAIISSIKFDKTLLINIFNEKIRYSLFKRIDELNE